MDRYRKRVHQVPFICEQIFLKSQDRQINGSNQRDGDQRDDIKNNQRCVRKGHPNIPVVEARTVQRQLNIKAAENRNGNEPQMQRNHQPVHCLKFVFYQFS